MTMQPVPPSSARPLALVAGASRGLGLLIATELARRGLDLVLTSRSRESLEEAREIVREAVPGADVQIAAVDVTDRDAIRRLVAEVESTRPIEVLITVAGVIQVGPAQTMTFEHFDQSIDTMLKGPVNMALSVLPAMRERGRGRIGTVTSIGGKVSPPHLLPYATAKFGAVGFSEGMTAELAGTGITATTIVPGLMRTGSHDRARFTGNAPAEFAWFGPASSLPGLTIDGEAAARKIVDGVLAGSTHVFLTPLAMLAPRVHGLLPEVTTRLLGLTNRLLPRAGAVDPGEPGLTVEGRVARQGLSERTRAVVDRLTTLNDAMGRRTNEHSQPSPTLPAPGDQAGRPPAG